MASQNKTATATGARHYSFNKDYEESFEEGETHNNNN
jgi:hypothetical protein